jgi:hypothetical protein
MKDYAELEGIEDREVTVHALADIRHMCDKSGWNYAELDRSAYKMYLQEREYDRRRL